MPGAGVSIVISENIKVSDPRRIDPFLVHLHSLAQIVRTTINPGGGIDSASLIPAIKPNAYIKMVFFTHTVTKS